MTTLRNIVGDMDLDQTLTSRDAVNSRFRTILDEATDKWGIKVTRVEIKNIAPPRDTSKPWRSRCGRNARGARPS